MISRLVERRKAWPTGRDTSQSQTRVLTQPTKHNVAVHNNTGSQFACLLASGRVDDAQRSGPVAFALGVLLQDDERDSLIPAALLGGHFVDDAVVVCSVEMVSAHVSSQLFSTRQLTPQACKTTTRKPQVSE